MVPTTGEITRTRKWPEALPAANLYPRRIIRYLFSYAAQKFTFVTSPKSGSNMLCSLMLIPGMLVLTLMFVPARSGIACGHVTSASHDVTIKRHASCGTIKRHASCGQ